MKCVKINKPLYGTFVYIRDKYLTDETCMVSIPQGNAIVYSSKWKEEAMSNKWIMDMKKNYDTPMRLYGGYVPLPSVTNVVKKDKPSQMKLF